MRSELPNMTVKFTVEILSSTFILLDPMHKGDKNVQIKKIKGYTHKDIAPIPYHLYPQFLHSNCDLAVLLNRPKAYP